MAAAPTCTTASSAERGARLRLRKVFSRADDQVDQMGPATRAVRGGVLPALVGDGPRPPLAGPPAEERPARLARPHVAHVVDRLVRSALGVVAVEADAAFERRAGARVQVARVADVAPVRAAVPRVVIGT